MKTQLTKRLATLGIISICAVGALTGCATSSTPKPSTSEATTPQTTSPETTPSTSQATSPMGQRPMIDVDGNRYVFLNNGTPFELKEEQLGKKIGEQNEGTLFELTGYNTGFRMAFEYDGAFYICENVGKSDDSAMDITAYLEAANLQEHVLYGDILDHMGGSLLNLLEQSDAIKVLDILEKAEVVELDTADYEAIAKAQAEGLSYRVEFLLEDQTTFTSYIIPSMNYVTIGDYTCVLEDLDAQIGSFFEGLEASDNIIYN